jgi:hypothetical protein
MVEGYQLRIKPRSDHITPVNQNAKLFFINLGGYEQNKFQEQHYVVLTVKPDRASALKQAKETFFFQHNYFKNAASHIDDEYGIDVDDIYQIEDILSPAHKLKYMVELVPSDNSDLDKINLGYLKLSRLE